MGLLTTVQPPASPPPEDDHVPGVGKDGFDCPRCGRWAHQIWGGLALGAEGVRRIEHPDGGLREEPTWRHAVCQRCHMPSVWRNEQMVYPLTRLGAQLHEDMPVDVRALYVEAATVAAVSRRAGAALARATVERLIKVLDPDAPAGATLDKRIDRIRPKVSSSLGEMLEVVRHLGNKMLHAEDRPGELVVLALDDQEGPALLELLLEAANDLVDELIAKPRTVARLRDGLPEHVKAKLSAGRSGGGGASDA